MKRKPEGHHKAMIDVHKSKTEQVMQPKHQSVEKSETIKNKKNAYLI